MGKPGRKFKVESNTLLDCINKHRLELFSNGTVVGPTNSVYDIISDKLDRKMSPYAVYVFIKRNKLAKTHYQEWGLKDDMPLQEAEYAIEDRSGKGTENSETSSESDTQTLSYRNFIITLSPEEWEKIAPREFFYRKGTIDNAKVYKALTPNTWTHIINEHFWEHTKAKCCLAFKRANVNETGFPYIKMIGFCKDCEGKFIGEIVSTPTEGKRVLVDCEYSSDSLCKKGKSKRQVKGSVKENALQSLINEKKSAMYYHLQETNRIMEHGDPEPSHLPTKNSLRCAKYKRNQEEYCDVNIFESINTAKYTTPFRESIHDVGLNKFFVRYWTPAQINSYREFVNTTPGSAVILDATGGLVKKIQRPFKNKSSAVFLYQAKVFDQDTGFEFPITQMLSERHDNMAIYAWLSDWLNTGVPPPKTFISDRSVAILSAAVKAFTQYKSLSDYIVNSYEVVFSNMRQRLPTCFIRCDIAHLIKNITTWHPLKELTKNVRSLYIRCFAEILKADSIEKVKQILSDVFRIATSLTVGKRLENGIPTDEDTPAEKARKTLKNLISNVTFEDDNYTEETNLELDAMTILTEDNERHSPFKSWAEAVLAESDQSRSHEGEHESALYCIKIIPYVLDLMKDLPLVTGVMIPFYGYGEVTASSARIETNFKNLKRIIFKDEELPMRADVFLTRHILILEGQLKISESKNRTEVRDSHQTNDETLSHYIPSVTNQQLQTCIKCRNYVNPNDDTSSQLLSLDDRTQIMCLSCIQSGVMIENAVRENWKGLGYSPVKQQSTQKSITSYLVRKPEIGTMDTSGKVSGDIGILKNGNRASELKPIRFKGREYNKITLKNTCAFDSFAQILACCYTDTTDDTMKKCFDLEDNPTNVIKFAKDLATKPVRQNTYINRFKILMTCFEHQELYPGGIVELDTSSTIAVIVEKLMRNSSSFTDVHVCSNAHCDENKILYKIVAQISLPVNGCKDLQSWLNSICEPSSSVCFRCQGEKKIQLMPSSKWLFLELYDTSTVSDEDVGKEIEVIPTEIPVEITIQNTTYILRGFVGFSGRRKSVNSIGHYVANIRRINGQWEHYDDTRNKKTPLSKSKKASCQLLVYSL